MLPTMTTLAPVRPRLKIARGFAIAVPIGILLWTLIFIAGIYLFG